MDDKIIPLVVLLFIGANFVVGLIQKAKAQEKRQRRPGEKAQEKPTVAVPSKPEVWRKQPTTEQRRAPGRRQTLQKQPVKPTGPRQQATRPQDVIREWAKRLEEALQPVEPPVQAPPKPLQVRVPTPSERKTTPSEIRRSVPRRPRYRPVGVPRPAPSSTAFLGRLHSNPLVNGVILSEVLSRPVALREDTPSLPR